MDEKIGWIDIDFKISCEKISLNNIKIKQKDYLPRGNYPVVDQGQELIGGYCDDSSLVIPEEPPFVIYGDHTKVKKYINFKFVAGADGVKVLKSNPFYNSKLFFYFIHSIKIPDKGYARHFQYLEKSSIPLPPLPEQRAIVSKIEQLFSELDHGIANLKLAQEQLKVYRQAVLKKAFEGELTRKWREQQTDFVPVSITINHFQSAKQHPKDRANYKVIKMDEANLSDLPPIWEWHSIIEVCNKVTVGHVGPMKDEYIEDGVPFLRSQNVRENRYDPSGLKFISPEFHNKIRKSALEPNDLVIVRSGVNAGMSCVIPDHLKEANCSDLVVIKQPFGFISKYGSYYLNSIAKSTIDSNKVGVAIPHFNTQSVANFSIPLCSLPEQQAIVQEIELRLSVCDKIEQDIETNLEKAEALRQSILKKAFEGKLLNERELAEVRGAEDWEPAEVLLERIRAERAENGKKIH
jgi:type I restriction enzyme S subunit